MRRTITVSVRIPIGIFRLIFFTFICRKIFLKNDFFEGHFYIYNFHVAALSIIFSWLVVHIFNSNSDSIGVSVNVINFTVISPPNYIWLQL